MTSVLHKPFFLHTGKDVFGASTAPLQPLFIYKQTRLPERLHPLEPGPDGETHADLSDFSYDSSDWSDTDDVGAIADAAVKRFYRGKGEKKESKTA